MAITLNPLKMKLPVQLVIMLAVVFFVGAYIPMEAKSFFYAISLSLKSVLMFVLPAIIFSYLSSCILSFKKGVVAFIVILLGAAYLSNVLGALFAYGVAYFTIDQLGIVVGGAAGGGMEKVLMPMWGFDLPVWLSNDRALFAGLGVGVIFSIIRVGLVERGVNGLKSAMAFFLSKLFIPVVPLFILGFIIKMEHDGVLHLVLTQYAPVFVLTVLVQVVYMVLLYFIAAGGNVGVFMQYVRNVVPSAVAGLSSSSSAAAMPLTLQGAEKNTQQVGLVRAIIPSTVNIHMIGNAITVTILGLAMARSGGVAMLSFEQFLMFALQFGLAQFSVAAVPSGGVLMMLPILEKYMAFTPDMSSLIMAVYILFDPTLTATNILGNGVLAIGLGKVFKKLKIGVE